ncbi:MAG: hypothetical protein QME96_15595, partial [Myxococcota bacterium]|nr:hypothetical protein [Myxococcota bacterium]
MTRSGLGWIAGAAAGLLAGCGDAGTAPDPDGALDTDAVEARDGEVCECADDLDCSDDEVCNGLERCVDCTCRAGTPMADGRACDDGDPCTESETCLRGACSGGTPSCRCSTDAECTRYDDDLCDGRLLCAGSRCVNDPGTAVVCDPSANTDCLVNRCVPATGLCGMTPTPDGTACDDGNACTAGDSCRAGSCVGGASTCRCTTDRDCAPHEDGNRCNGALECASGACVVDPATVVTCPRSPDPCRVNQCDPTTGICSAVAAPAGTTCDDGNACTVGDTCSGGACTGSPRSCNDGNVCTSDGCNTATGCVYSALTGPSCDDGDPCTLNDACSSGVCTGARLPYWYRDADADSYGDPALRVCQA